MMDRIKESAAPHCFFLPGGMRLVCCQAVSPAEYFGVAVNAGSRDERPAEHGLAHFVEHTIFKGTARRRSHHIINRMEAVGGELNAFTSKEETYVYSAFPTGNLNRAMELIADLTLNSVFPAAELEKERSVVEEEIDACLDTPAESVYDDFEDLIFAGSQFGHNILGTKETIARFGTQDCLGWIRRQYTAGRMTAFYYGQETPERVKRAIERYFGAHPAEGCPERLAPEVAAPFGVRREAPSHQANTIVGARTEGVYSPDRHALALLVNILGGPGMNSRLNVALRERRGLVYSVEASLTGFTDCGLFTVYYGCDPDDNGRCLDLVRGQLRRIATEPLTPRALQAAKKQFLGQMRLSAVNVEQTVMNAARSMMFRGEVPGERAVAQAVESVSADDILRIAAALQPENCSWLTLG